MKKILLSFSLVLLLASCETNVKTVNSNSDPTPACIKEEVELFSKTECDKHPNVKEYQFQGQQVFVFDPGQCGADMTSEVKDKNCRSLGYLGGFTGNVKINGRDFSEATFVRTVWEK